MYHYETARQLLANIIEGFRVLSGDEVGPSGETWQGIAPNVSRDLCALSDTMMDACRGEVRDGPVVFPSPDDYVRIVAKNDDCYACEVGDTHTTHHPETQEEHKQAPGPITVIGWPTIQPLGYDDDAIMLKVMFPAYHVDHSKQSIGPMNLDVAFHYGVILKIRAEDLPRYIGSAKLVHIDLGKLLRAEQKSNDPGEGGD